MQSEKQGTFSSLTQNVKEKLGFGDSSVSKGQDWKVYDLKQSDSELSKILQPAKQEAAIDFWAMPWHSMNETPELSCDIVELVNGVQFKLDVPGVDQNHIECRIHEKDQFKVLEVKVLRPVKLPNVEGACYIRKERAYGVATRKFAIRPEYGLDLNAPLKTALCHGVLCICIPKIGQQFTGDHLEAYTQSQELGQERGRGEFQGENIAKSGSSLGSNIGGYEKGSSLGSNIGGYEKGSSLGSDIGSAGYEKGSSLGSGVGSTGYEKGSSLGSGTGYEKGSSLGSNIGIGKESESGFGKGGILGTGIGAHSGSGGMLGSNVSGSQTGMTGSGMTGSHTGGEKMFESGTGSQNLAGGASVCPHKAGVESFTSHK